MRSISRNLDGFVPFIKDPAKGGRELVTHGGTICSIRNFGSPEISTSGDSQFWTFSAVNRAPVLNNILQLVSLSSE